MRDWLREKRRERGLTEEHMAERLGISAPYYSFIENGLRQKKMTIDFAVKLADALSIPLDAVIRWETK